jgi:ATP-dependent RNA circularization protein (DNA/RNA ligase family)
MKYPKINTIWKRDKDNKFNIIEGDFSKPEFEAIRRWDITEKIDGTNIRVMYENDVVKFGGRTDNAQIPAHLFEKLQTVFTVDKMRGVFGDDTVTLFGEGYGPKIQKGGGLYRKDAGFILFDVVVGDWWLNRSNVEVVASNLDINCVELIGTMSYSDAVKYVQSSPTSLEADQIKTMEGVVARSNPLMLFRNGNPIMWKLKDRDFK